MFGVHRHRTQSYPIAKLPRKLMKLQIYETATFSKIAETHYNAYADITGLCKLHVLSNKGNSY